MIVLGASNQGINSNGVAGQDIFNRRTVTYDASGNPGPNARVFTGNFDNLIESGRNRADTVTQFSTAVAGTAAHEYGHTLGLLHHFVYSNDGIAPRFNNLNNTGGLQNEHVIGTGVTGITENIREAGPRTFSPFSQVMLDVAGGTFFVLLPVLGAISNADELCDVLSRCCLQHVVGNRPDRYEPRVLKRRPKKYAKLMQKPRRNYKPSDV